ncbi:MAG: nucleoside-diphosphate-sugar epimerase [Pseudohongiellaceae bacterium]|jgi:nucleoside-diphosphate-sugar epimerase
MLNIVLTGATGYVGRALLKTLEQLPAGTVSVKALVRSAKGIKLPAFAELIEGCLPDVPNQLFFEAPHVLIHLGVKQIDDGSGFHNTNVLGTQNLLEKCNAHTLGTLYGSTLSVQGQKAQSSIVESEALHPQTELAESRAQAEQLVSLYMENFEKWGFNLRPRFILGKEDQYVLPGLTKLARNGVYIGNGKQKYSVITVNDYAEVILRLTQFIYQQSELIGKKLIKPEQMPVNVGYQQPLSFDQIFTEIRDHLVTKKRVISLRFPGWLPSLLKWIPNKVIESKATQLELIGFDHYGDVSRLQQLIGLDIIQQNSLDKLKSLFD